MSSKATGKRPATPKKRTGLSATPTAKQVTPADAWRSPRSEGLIIELPSGNVARLRRTLDLDIMLQQGKIPNPLSVVIKDIFAQIPIDQNMSIEDQRNVMHQMLELTNSQMPHIFLEPKAVVRPEDAPEDWEPPSGCIEVSDIDREDRIFAYQFAQGGTADLNRFRSGQIQAVADMDHVERLEGEAK